MYVTEHDLLQSDSIFDVLTRLGFTEDQEQERMVAPKGTHVVAFTQIGGRTVAEFVRWGMKTGLLVPYLAGTPRRLLRESRILRKPPACPTLNRKRSKEAWT